VPADRDRGSKSVKLSPLSYFPSLARDIVRPPEGGGAETAAVSFGKGSFPGTFILW